MGEYLSEKEENTRWNVIGITNTLPANVKDYCKHELQNKHRSYYAVYTDVRNVKIFYESIFQRYNIEPLNVENERIASLLTDELIEDYLSTPVPSRRKEGLPKAPDEEVIKKRKYILYRYLEFLKEEHIIDVNPIEKPGQKKLPKKTIKNGKIVFTGNSKIKTTLDGKYSLIRERYGSQYNQSHYSIRDEESGSLFLADNGETLYIESYVDAREFVKNLYEKKPKKRR